MRVSQRKGFLSVKEFKEAGKAEEQKRKKKRKKVDPEKSVGPSLKKYLSA